MWTGFGPTIILSFIDPYDRVPSIAGRPKGFRFSVSAVLNVTNWQGSEPTKYSTLGFWLDERTTPENFNSHITVHVGVLFIVQALSI